MFNSYKKCNYQTLLKTEARSSNIKKCPYILSPRDFMYLDVHIAYHHANDSVSDGLDINQKYSNFSVKDTKYTILNW